MNTKKVVLWVAVAVAAVLVFVMCAPGTGAQAATRTSTQGQDFTSQAEVVKNVRCRCWVWGWSNSWWVKNKIGKVQYWFGIDVQWRANAKQRRVTGLVYNYCLDKGGYFNFDGCKRQHGGFGYRTLGMYSVWHYHFGIDAIGVTVHRDPSVRFDLASNGWVTGTVYYDN